MDNFKEAYDELVHKHLSLKEENEGLVAEAKETAGEMIMVFFFGLVLGIAGVIVVLAVIS